MNESVDALVNRVTLIVPTWASKMVCDLYAAHERAVELVATHDSRVGVIKVSGHHNDDFSYDIELNGKNDPLKVDQVAWALYIAKIPMVWQREDGMTRGSIVMASFVGNSTESGGRFGNVIVSKGPFVQRMKHIAQERGFSIDDDQAYASAHCQALTECFIEAHQDALSGISFPDQALMVLLNERVEDGALPHINVIHNALYNLGDWDYSEDLMYALWKLNGDKVNDRITWAIDELGGTMIGRDIGIEMIHYALENRNIDEAIACALVDSAIDLLSLMVERGASKVVAEDVFDVEIAANPQVLLHFLEKRLFDVNAKCIGVLFTSMGINIFEDDGAPKSEIMVKLMSLANELIELKQVNG